jgi:hypothetical protein
MNPLTTALAQTIKEMVAERIYDPHYAEIAARYYADRPEHPMGGRAASGVQQLLKQLKSLLAAEEHDVVLVNSKYYSGTRSRRPFREEPATNEDDAKLVLPIGFGNESVGLYFAQSKNDPILKVSLGHTVNRGAGLVSRNTELTYQAHQNGHLDAASTAQIVRTGYERATPEHAAELNQIVSAAASPEPEEAP